MPDATTTDDSSSKSASVDGPAAEVTASKTAPKKATADAGPTDQLDHGEETAEAKAAREYAEKNPFSATPAQMLPENQVNK